MPHGVWTDNHTPHARRGTGLLHRLVDVVNINGMPEFACTCCNREFQKPALNSDALDEIRCRKTDAGYKTLRVGNGGGDNDDDDEMWRGGGMDGSDINRSTVKREEGWNDEAAQKDQSGDRRITGSESGLMATRIAT